MHVSCTVACALGIKDDKSQKVNASGREYLSQTLSKI